MTIIFMDGFDHYEMTDLLKKWTYASYTPAYGTILGTISKEYAYLSGKGYYLSSGNTIYKTFPANYDELVVGFMFKHLSTGGNPSTQAILTFYDSTAEQCSIRSATGGKLTFNRTTTVLQTSAATLALNTWYHIEAKIKIHNSLGAFEVRVNGVSGSWLSGSGVDCAISANNYANGVGIGSQNVSGLSSLFDDLYVLNTASAPYNTFIGAQKIMPLFADSPGTYNEWTPNWVQNFGNINDPAVNVDTFNYSATGSQVDTFGFQTVASGSVTGIQINITTKQDGGVQRTIAPHMIFGGSAVSGSSINLTTDWTTKTIPFDADPSGNPWTPDNINTTEFGYKLVA